MTGHPAKAIPEPFVLQRYGLMHGTNVTLTVSRREISEMWTPEYVGLALVAAFRTLDRLPAVSGPKQYGNGWPSTTPVQVEWRDLLAQASLELGERMDREKEANRVKIAPTAKEITQMNAAFDWLREMRRKDAGMALIATLWAMRTARGHSVRRLCREKGWPHTTFLRKRAKALRWMAESLNERRAPVF